MEVKKITISAQIRASAEQVWNCYTQPKHITQWNFASPEWHCPSASNELEVGGRLITRMEARDGSFGFDFGGIYHEIIWGRKLVYTMDDERKVGIDFSEREGLVEVSLCFDAETQNPIELQRQGWQSILNNFKTYTEQVSQ